MIRIILNGKKADFNGVRAAISLLRNTSAAIEVRITWEQGDAERLVREASHEGVQRIVAAGGDGTLNEVVNAMAKLNSNSRPELAILPLGTANDFASACTIPLEPTGALQLALHGTPRAVDIVQANDKYFINIASGGFGAQVSADIPVQLKNFLGGGAYALSAVVKAPNFFNPGRGRLTAEGVDLDGAAIVAVVCNGRQAGGGQVLAADAYINDGLMDIMVILAFPLIATGQVLQEVLTPLSSGEYVKRFRSKWVEAWLDEYRCVNLDGEPYKSNHIRFDVLPEEIQLILPEDCPCLAKPLG